MPSLLYKGKILITKKLVSLITGFECMLTKAGGLNVVLMD